MRYDYVIVGGGSAGCALANRLSADGRHSVCLLEAGPRDSSIFINIPSGVIPLMRSKFYNWQFWTTPQANLHNRRLYWPRGKTLGGSSAINAMCAIRGHAWDYDHWASLGNSGWSYKDVLPYFKQAENYEPGLDAGGALTAEAAQYHGQGGPLNIADRRHSNPLSALFLEAAQQAGYRLTPDFNGAQQEGMGYYRVFQKNGERCSNARAYLREAESRANLTVITGAHATRVLFDGKRAVGVRYFEAGRYVDVLAAREVILAGGAIGSPHLLLLSGVGPKAELERHGIALVHELPGVGENLQDHLDVIVSVRSRTRLPMSLHPLSLLRALAGLFRYLFGRRGEYTSNVAEAGGFLKSKPAEPIPDIQWHFIPLGNSKHALELGRLVKHYAYSVLTCDLRPLSRGRITLDSADPLAAPRIDPNYVAHERDLERLVAGVKKVREVLAQNAFDPHRRVELEPGPEVQTDEQIRDWVRGHAETIYHPVGSCKMGVDDMAVVDPRLRVRGLEHLRVVDASIMPTLVGGNTNAPTTMIAERGAAMILQDSVAPNVTQEFSSGTSAARQTAPLTKSSRAA
jgi:choline dehydrogenase-like flavoprotein